jgi:hypothetical protein
LPNSGGNSLTGTLTIAGIAYTVTQGGAGCTYTLGSPSTSVASTGLTAPAGSFTFSTVTSGCSPSAMSFASWITNVVTQFSGTSGTVTFGVSQNVGGAARTGTIEIGSQTYMVMQTGASCSFSLNSTGEALSSSGLVVGPAGAPENILGSPSAQGCLPPQVSTNQPSIIGLGALSGPTGDIYTQPYFIKPPLPYSPVDLLPRYMQIIFGGQIFTVKQYPW